MPRLRVPVTDRDHIRGPDRAPITLVEYGDFQCPACGRAFWLLRDLEDRYRRELRVVFRHFPLTEIHVLALAAAEAAEAAGAYGKFWEMHDLLFENQPAFELDDLIGYAAEVEVDVQAFTAELASNRHRARIRDDFMGGTRSGVNGTPCLFLDDERYDGAIEELPLVIEGRRSRPRAGAH